MIEYFETHIEDACNLRCRGCSHFSGLVKKSRPKDIGEFEREFKRIAEIEEVGTIRIMGGEPLLNPNFMDYLHIARRYFPYSNIVLVTNGILVDRLLPHRASLVDLHIRTTVSNYHIDIQDFSKISQLPYVDSCEKGDLYNISFDLDGNRNKERAFANCDLHQHRWFFLRNGKFYPCCVAGCIKDFWEHFGLDFGFDQEDLGIDIYEHTAEEIEEFLNRPIELCRFCDTEKRGQTYAPFSKSKGEIDEWTR